MYFFAYGMLTSTDLMSYRSVEYYGAASLPGYELELFSYANLVPSPGAEASGVLYNIDENILAQLDLVEGYPVLYTRTRLMVECQGMSVRAWVYLMTENTRQRMSDSLPMSDYINMMRRGYTEADMSTHEIDRALANARKRVQGERK